MYGCTAMQAGIAPVITELCQGLIRGAHDAGECGTPAARAFGPFGAHGVSREMFDTFVSSLANVGLIELRADHTLHATRKGLAYLGLSPSGVRVPDPARAAATT